MARKLFSVNHTALSKELAHVIAFTHKKTTEKMFCLT